MMIDVVMVFLLKFYILQIVSLVLNIVSSILSYSVEKQMIYKKGKPKSVFYIDLCDKKSFLFLSYIIGCVSFFYNAYFNEHIIFDENLYIKFVVVIIASVIVPAKILTYFNSTKNRITYQNIFNLNSKEYSSVKIKDEKHKIIKYFYLEQNLKIYIKNNFKTIDKFIKLKIPNKK